MTVQRYKFIDTIRDGIVDNLPGAAEAGYAAVDAWEAGEDPLDAYQAGVFEVCEKVRADIQNATGDK